MKAIKVLVISIIILLCILSTIIALAIDPSSNDNEIQIQVLDELEYDTSNQQPASVNYVFWNPTNSLLDIVMLYKLEFFDGSTWEMIYEGTNAFFSHTLPDKHIEAAMYRVSATDGQFVFDSITGESFDISYVPDDLNITTEFINDDLELTFMYDVDQVLVIIAVKKDETSRYYPIPLRKGYDFCGWYLDETLNEKANLALMIFENDTVLYPKWSNLINDTDYIFGLNNYKEIDDQYDIEGFAIEGYNLEQWVPNNQVKQDNDPLYMMWTKALYTVIFDYGQCGVDAYAHDYVTSISSDYYSIIQLPDITLDDGHEILSWSERPDLNGEIYQPGSNFRITKDGQALFAIVDYE